MQVEIWSDVVCPWCYIGKRHFERALESFAHLDEVEVVYRAFELDPSAPTAHSIPTVELLASKYGMSQDQARQAQEQVTERAAAAGLEFHLDDLMSGNTRDAHRVVQLARRRGLQAEFVERLHRAYFVEGGAIFDQESLVGYAVEVGLDGEEVLEVLRSGAFDDDIDDDEATARRLGASGVPFFVFDRRYGVSGAQPVEVLLGTLERIWSDTLLAAADVDGSAAAPGPTDERSR